MAWIEEILGWLSERFVYDEIGPELDRLSSTLRSGDLDDRLSAVKQLTFMKAADSVSLLLGALKDTDPAVRGAAASALGYKVSAEGVTPLAVLLGDADPAVRSAAVRALDEIGLPRARRWARLDTLVTTAPDIRIPDLLGRSLTDDVSDVAASALSVLPRHGARGVQIVVENIAATEVGNNRDWKLSAAEPELILALSASEPAHRKAAVQALHSLYGETSVRSLAEALRDEDPEVRSAAVDAVTALGPRPALEELLGRLGDPDESVVCRVVEGLVCARNLATYEEQEEDRIQEEMLRLAKYGSGRARAMAAWALGEIGRVSAVSTLCDLLDEKRSPEATIAACEALGKINDPRAVAPMLALVHISASSGVMVAAIRNLARADDLRVVPVFVQMLFADGRPEVEQALDEAISRVFGTVEQSARADLQNEDAGVRLTAIRRAITDPRLAFLLIERVLEAPSEEERLAATDVLTRQGFDLATLARSSLQLGDKSEKRRILAINLIAALRPEDAEVLLDGILQDTNEPVEVYRHAVAALKRIGTSAARNVLARHSGHANETVRGWVNAAIES